MNNEIKNKKVEVNDMELNDKDIINILLNDLKYLVKTYSVSLTESSNSNLCQKERKMFLDCLSNHRKIYDVMFRNGWYVVEKIDDIKLNEKYNMLNNLFDNIK